MALKNELVTSATKSETLATDNAARKLGTTTTTVRERPRASNASFQAINQPALTDTGQERIATMDTAGICMQVLSVPGPGAEVVSGPDGIAIAREFNNRMAQLISARPERFAALAHLPMRSRSAAADELERAVMECGLNGALISGTIDGKFLDAPEFERVLACAERLDVPLYIHPGLPPRGVHAAYYNALPDEASFGLAIAGWGWHAETAVHILRLALSGALDRHPRLKLLIRHMGEGLPTMMERVAQVFGAYRNTHLERNAARSIAEQVWVSTSGFSSMPAFLAAARKFRRF